MSKELARDWIEADFAEAFPEIPAEVIAQFADGAAEQTAKELDRPLSPVDRAFLYGDGTGRKTGLV